jgi:hypothetical protein
MIKEGISEIMKLIQGSNEDQYIGWMMKNKRVQWSTLQQKKRKQYLVWKKNERLKKDELKQILMVKDEVNFYEHEGEVFLRENSEANKRLAESLMEFPDSGSQQE